MGKTTGTCPHCGKTFRISKIWLAVFFPAVFLVLTAVNFFLLSIPDMSLIVLFVTTLAGVAAAYFLIPFFLQLKADPVHPNGKMRGKF